MWFISFSSFRVPNFPIVVFINTPLFQDLLKDIIFPLMCFTDEDKEVWEDDPHEYIRMKFGGCCSACVQLVCSACVFVYSAWVQLCVWRLFLMARNFRVGFHFRLTTDLINDKFACQQFDHLAFARVWLLSWQTGVRTILVLCAFWPILATAENVGPRDSVHSLFYISSWSRSLFFWTIPPMFASRQSPSSTRDVTVL